MSKHSCTYCGKAHPLNKQYICAGCVEDLNMKSKRDLKTKRFDTPKTKPRPAQPFTSFTTSP